MPTPPPSDSVVGASSAHAARIVYGIFLLVGLASSLPWNVFVTAEAYFRQRLDTTPYAESFVIWCSTGFNITALLTMVFRTVCIAERMPSAVKTVFTALVVMLSVILGHAVLTRMPTFHGEAFFQLTMLSIVVVACATTLMQDGLFRLVSLFPPKFTQAIVAGQAMAGVVVAISNFGILAANGANVAVDDSEDSRPFSWIEQLGMDADLCAFVYFVFVFFVVILCTLAFVVMTRINYFRHYRRLGKRRPKKTTKHKTQKIKLLDEDASVSIHERLLGDNDIEVNGINTTDQELDAFDLLTTLRNFGSTAFFVYLLTAALFPGITALAQSMSPSRGRFFRDLFVPFSFILMNVGDLFGRWLAARWTSVNATRLFHWSLSRLALIPLFMLCHLENEHHVVITHVVFASDVFPMLFLLVMAVTNGLVLTLAMMHYPRILATPVEKEMGGTIMFFLLSIGLSAGSLLSFVLRAMLKS